MHFSDKKTFKHQSKFLHFHTVQKSLIMDSLCERVRRVLKQSNLSQLTVFIDKDNSLGQTDPDESPFF